MVIEDPKTPHDPNTQLDGGGDLSPPNAPKNPIGDQRREMASKGKPLILPGGSKDKDGRTTTDSTRRRDSRRDDELVGHSKNVQSNGDILDKKRQEIEEYARLIKRREREIREIE